MLTNSPFVNMCLGAYALAVLMVMFLPMGRLVMMLGVLTGG